MAETTYLLGAGVNRCVEGPDGLVPPLARDFFQQALRHPRIAADYTISTLAPLLEFIQRYWHLSREDLKVAELDIEECFTFLELQRREAEASGERQVLARASTLEWLMTQLLLDVMSECEHWFPKSPEFQRFAGRLLSERAAILTFNYDTLLESALESASPSRADAVAVLMARGPVDGEIRDEEIAYTPNEWNPYLAYNVPFDEVALRVPGNLRMVDGERYFSVVRNKTKTSPFLKLHGSLGWFFHSGYRVDGVPLEGEEGSQVGKSVLRRSFQRLGVPQLDYAAGEILLPLIITPVLNKLYDRHPVFRTIWAEAANELRDCRRLVIGGYSFPPTDFHVRRLLREVYSNASPQELCIINPDTRVVQVAKELCNYRKPIMVCNGIGEFLEKNV